MVASLRKECQVNKNVFCNYVIDSVIKKASNKVNAYDTADDELLSIDVSIHQEHLHLVTEVFLNQ